MIDFHSHILPGVDDGARTEDESKQMIAALNNNTLALQKLTDKLGG